MRVNLLAIISQCHMGWQFLNAVGSFGWTVWGKRQLLYCFGRYQTLTSKSKALCRYLYFNLPDFTSPAQGPPVQETVTGPFAHLDVFLSITCCCSVIKLLCFIQGYFSMFHLLHAWRYSCFYWHSHEKPQEFIPEWSFFSFQMYDSQPTPLSPRLVL